jgi:hypothetical protein
LLRGGLVTLFHAAVRVDTGVGRGVGKGAAPDMVNVVGAGVTSEVPRREASRTPSVPAGVALFNAGVVAGTAMDANGDGDVGGAEVGVGVGVGVGVDVGVGVGVGVGVFAVSVMTLLASRSEMIARQNRFMALEWAWR